MVIIRNLRTFVYALAFLVFSQSCKKDHQPEIDIEKFVKCYDKQNYDSIALSSELIGTWELVAKSCFWTGELIIDKVVNVTLTSMGTFSVKENSNVVTTGSWKLKMIGSENFELALDTSSKYLWGNIFVCDDQVLFYDSYRDGCDKLFVRTN